MSDADFHKIAKAAIKLGWLDAQRAADAGYSARFAGLAQRSSREAAEHQSQKLEELRAFKDAKDHLLAALDHFATTCESLRHSKVVDAGERDLKLLEEDQASLDTHDLKALRRLQKEAVFAPLADPRMLSVQLNRAELSFPFTGRRSESTPQMLFRSTRCQRADVLYADDLILDDDAVAISSYRGWANLVKLSETYRQLNRKRLVKRLESLVNGGRPYHAAKVTRLDKPTDVNV